MLSSARLQLVRPSTSALDCRVSSKSRIFAFTARLFYIAKDAHHQLCSYSNASPKARKALTDSLIKSFGLTRSADVLVGTPLRKGLSGGQKRRVSVAAQLVTGPNILFLDEPTSGKPIEDLALIVITSHSIKLPQDWTHMRVTKWCLCSKT